MSIEKEFLIKTRTKYIFQNYENLILQIAALKTEEIYQILYMRVEYTSDSEERFKSFKSLDKEAIIIEEIINEQKISERIINKNGNLIYFFNDINLFFVKKIEFPTNYDEFLEKINSQCDIHHRIYLQDDINFIYLKNLYSLGSLSNSRSINLMDDSSFEEIHAIEKTEKFCSKIFVKRGNIFNGKDYIENNFGRFWGEGRKPKLVIIFPVKSFNIKFSFPKCENSTQIDIALSISADFKQYIEVCYIKSGRKFSIKENDLSMKIERNYSKSLDFIVLWKGNSDLLPIDTKIYWKNYFFLVSYFDKTKEEINEIEKEIKDLLVNLENSKTNDKKLELYPIISEKYHILKNSYQSLQDDGPFDFSDKIEELYNKRIENYKEFIANLEQKVDRREIDYSYYLTLNNILYDKYVEKRDEIYQRHKREIEHRSWIAMIGETEISELNEMLLNIEKAFSNIASRITNAFLRKDNFELISLFEILGDLHIHSALLNLLSPHPNEKFHFKNAESSYKKALKFYNKISIPGIGRASIRVTEYMKIFNIFMKADGLINKIDYIQKYISSKRDDYATHPISIPLYGKEPNKTKSTFISEVASNILNEIKMNYEKLGKSYSDLLQFIGQAPNVELQIALAFILKQTYLRTTKEIAEDLKEMILMHVDSLDNVHLVLFDDIEMKSNELWNNLIPRVLEERINYIRPSGILDLIRKIDLSNRHFCIFLDNIIGLGDQFVDMFKKNFPSEITDNIKKIKKEHNNLFFKVIAAIGSDKSRIQISNEIPIFEFDDIIYKKTIREEDRAFYSNNWSNEDMLTNIKKYLEEIDPKFFAGRNNSQFLVITEDARPNNTIGCLWRNINGKWRALFPRVSYSKRFIKHK